MKSIEQWTDADYDEVWRMLLIRAKLRRNASITLAIMIGVVALGYLL